MSRFHFIYHHLMLDSCIKVSMQLKKTKLYTILLLFVPPFNSSYHFRTLLIMNAPSREQINEIKNSISSKISDKTQKNNKYQTKNDLLRSHYELRRACNRVSVLLLFSLEMRSCPFQDYIRAFC